MRKKGKKLTLAKETLRRLEDAQLKKAAGAYPVTAMSRCEACSEFYSCNVYTWCGCG
jgi:hypothetical protein